jgi:hypothetical protein
MQIENVILEALAGRGMDAALLALVLIWLAKIAWPQLMKQQRELFDGLKASHREDWQMVREGQDRLEGQFETHSRVSLIQTLLVQGMKTAEAEQEARRIIGNGTNR